MLYSEWYGDGGGKLTGELILDWLTEARDGLTGGTDRGCEIFGFILLLNIALFWIGKLLLSWDSWDSSVNTPWREKKIK